MKIHLIKLQTIKDFMRANAQSRKGFETWLSILSFVDWGVPNDIIKTYRSADILGKGSERVVFNIGGNNYRMICAYFFGKKQVHLFVKWIGTHAEYDELCKKNLQFTIDN